MSQSPLPDSNRRPLPYHESPLGQLGLILGSTDAESDRAEGGSESRPMAQASTHHVPGNLPPFEPFHQKSRSAKRCAACVVCAYCGHDVTDDRHDHDHSPIPWRHGGRHVVAACMACHGLRDYKALDRWPRVAIESAAAGLANGSAVWVMALLVAACAPDTDMAVGDVAEIVTAAMADCTTAEARVALAFATGVALDAEKRRAALEDEPVWRAA